MNEETKTEHPFELIVGSETGEIMNGDVPVRWCVTPELVKKLEDDKIIDPHVLLVTADDRGREMQRQLVPITELMTYVRFTKAGKMKLYGFIIDGAEGRKKLYRMYQRKVSGGYETDIMFHYTSLPHDDLYGEYVRTDVTVEIPAGVFGKEPGPWMKWFVNLWHTDSGRVVDECHYRRRLILAFSLKWIPVLIWAIFSITAHVVITGSLALAGWFKGMKFWRSFRPFKYSDIEFHLLDDVNMSFEGNAFLFKRKHLIHDWKETMFFTTAVNPFILLVVSGSVALVAKEGMFLTITATILGVIFAISVIWDGISLGIEWLEKTDFFEKADSQLGKMIRTASDYNVRKYITWALIGLVTIAIFVITMYFELFFAIFVPLATAAIVAGVLWKWSDAILERLDNACSVAPERNDYTEIRELLCPKDADNLKPDIHYIPPKQRTIRLWYLDMKNKVCKPMQR